MKHTDCMLQYLRSKPLAPCPHVAISQTEISRNTELVRAAIGSSSSSGLFDCEGLACSLQKQLMLAIPVLLENDL